jgi:hypothetical protein
MAREVMEESIRKVEVLSKLLATMKETYIPDKSLKDKIINLSTDIILKELEELEEEDASSIEDLDELASRVKALEP